MDFVIGILLGLCLGIFACVMLYALIVAFRPAPPTMYGRRKLVQWELPATRHEPPPMPSVAPAREAGSISYEFINLTGLEE